MYFPQYDILSNLTLALRQAIHKNQCLLYSSRDTTIPSVHIFAQRQS